MGVEKINLKDIQIESLLNEDFKAELSSKFKNAIPISLVIIEQDGKKIIPIILNHENVQEIKEKILHLSSPIEENLTKVKEILKEKFNAND